jgi:hypothetical protein
LIRHGSEEAPGLLPLDAIKSEVSGFSSSLAVTELMHEIDANTAPDPPAVRGRKGRTSTLLSLKSAGSAASRRVGLEEDNSSLAKTDTRQTLFSGSSQLDKTTRRTSQEIDDEFAEILGKMPTSRSPSPVALATTQKSPVGKDRHPDKKLSALSTASSLKNKNTKESDDWDAIDQLNRFALGAADGGDSPGPAARASSSSFANQSDKLRDRMKEVRKSSAAFCKMVKKDKQNRESDAHEKPDVGNDSDSGESLWGDNTNSSNASEDDWQQLKVQLDP